MRRIIAIVLPLFILWPVWAQTYPEKPVRMVVPFPAGGPLDTVARVFSAKLAERFGQPFLVDNRSGAGGSLGMDFVAKASPDGYTVLWSLDSMLTVNPILYREFGEPLERLRMVTLLTESVATLVVHPSLNVQSSSEFVKLSRSRDLSYASAGVGSPGHRTMEYYMLVTGAHLTHVPYKGNAPAVQGLLAGQTHAFITPIAGVLPHIRAGRLRPLAVTSAKRNPTLSDVPTMVELGYPKFNVVAWYCVLVPAKTPQAIVDALDSELVRIMQLPDVRERLAKASLDPVWDSAKAALARAREERKMWAEVIEKTGMKME